MDPVTLVLRWAHILAAIVALGGLIFARFAVVPAAEELGKETADKLNAGIRRRWLLWVIGAITLLLASGLTNYILLMKRIKASPELWGGDWMRQTGYHTLFGVKFLLAMVIFYLASGLVGRGASTQWMRDNRKQWLSVTVGLGVAVVLVSGWMRQLHTGANEVPVVACPHDATAIKSIEDFNAPESGDDGSAKTEEKVEGKSDGQEAKETNGSAPSEDRETPAASDGGQEAA